MVLIVVIIIIIYVPSFLNGFLIRTSFFSDAMVVQQQILEADK